jgi:DnaJ-class molecular chaperone
MKDPYDALGIERTATDKEIGTAYRRLAKEYHPDLHPGDKTAESRFKEISAAYQILKDPDKRGRYDRGEIDAGGQERPERSFYRAHADAEDGAKYARYEDFADFADKSDIFADLFRQTGDGRRAHIKMRGADIAYSLRIGFLEAANGAKKRVTMPDGVALDITVPEGVLDRQTLRLKGKGHPGLGGGPPGDAYIEIHIEPHPVFERKDNNIHITLPITLGEAVLGGKIDVPTIKGAVSMTIPKGSNTGTALRLKGRGILDPKSKDYGDQYITLEVVLPREIDDTLSDFVESWASDHPYNPRSDMKGV